ncbi:acetate--CoA ligase family protein [Rhizobium jaguaris]|uniref:acetate--CoA ligase family protein n=1 Tax=Rhizobium jaguaris TaxID=1312183 RepID=UPI001FE0F7D7|nr:acetate--CoA ligase family protein [Rhizobium jaguaris]
MQQSRDVHILTPDLPDDAIIRELYRLKSASLLRGFRGSPPRDMSAAARIIATLGRLLLAEPTIREIDLKPVVIYPDGEGAVALDAPMLAAPYPRTLELRNPHYREMITASRHSPTTGHGFPRLHSCGRSRDRLPVRSQSSS